MPREIEPSLNERQFFTAALEENIRLDGRGLEEYRPIKILFGDDYGVSEASFGKTR